ncbi:DUF3310 domain-containing protein [Streptomyces sp. URMC 125]|uniref:DUF3310 domain-containing protein n=1 Tax=Streptomyces sp. URMC 125 TaxID=3423419 RepID=UPI003F1E4423
MRFKVGDRVRVTRPEGGELSAAGALFVGQLGTVADIDNPEDAPYPYAVAFDTGSRLCFAEDELTYPEDSEAVIRFPRHEENLAASESDPVHHPSHYTSHPSGIECIQITEHMNFCLGNAMKYIWRAGLKTDDPIQDIDKAIWYLQREKERLSK